MNFEQILNEVKRLNMARKNNIKMNTKNNNGLYELNRSTIKAELAKLQNKKLMEVK
jgi:hypothetical protein